jgi:hypothetical protein
MDNLKIFYWNIYKKDLYDPICNIGNNYDPDIIILLESQLSKEKLLSKLNSDELKYKHNADLIEKGSKIMILSKSSLEIKPLKDGNPRYCIKLIKFDHNDELILVTIHLPSKLQYSPEDQECISNEITREILLTEENLCHKKTIIIGDFNMNPFEPGMICGNAFNSVMTKKIALKEKRIINDKEYYYFYNPMWNYFGDLRNDVPGTFHYHGSTYYEYFWNIFDQVLFRPSLLHMIDSDSIKILNKIGPFDLCNLNGIPDKKTYSDHLPLFININLKEVQNAQ